MVPLLAPLLGSLAGSLLPATVGTGVAGALGLSGTAAGLVAAAAPKAIGAGIGTLLAGGDLGEAALNAVGFGAGGALLGGAGAGAGAANTGAQMAAAGAANAGAAAPVAAAAPAAAAAAPVAAAAPAATATAAAPAMDFKKLLGIAEAAGPLMGGQGAPAAPAPQAVQGGGTRAQENPMLAQMQGPMPARSTAMPAAVGIGTIPMGGQQPMSNDRMFAGMGPDQQRMVGDYLRSQGMVGFA
jgi:hypothetical protein